MAEDQRTAVTTAARAAFARHGVDRTRMADVAKEAGMARQTLYDVVSGREELIELALLDCCRALQARLDAEVSAGPQDLSDALVEFLARSVEITRDDQEFTLLARALPVPSVERLLGDSMTMQAMIAGSLQPLLQRAAREQRLRAGVSIAEASHWLQGVMTFMLVRENTDGRALRDEMRKFAVPSVFRWPAHLPTR